MSFDEGNAKRKIWGLAAMAGIVAFLALKYLANYTFGAALLLAVLIAILVAILIWIGFYRDADETDETDGAESTTAPSAASASAAPPATTSRTATAPEAATSPAPAKPAPAKKPSRKKPSTKKTSNKKSTTKKSPTKKPAAKAKPAAKGHTPKTLKKPGAGGADDFKVLKGVGPAVEKTLNELGFFHYDQISGWSAKDIDWVDQRLRFKGRIVRDGWIKQAKSLAKSKA